VLVGEGERILLIIVIITYLQMMSLDKYGYTNSNNY